MSADELTPQMRRWTWAVWSKEGPPHVAQKAICQVLFSYLATSPDGKVFPSVDTIAEKTGLTRKTVGGHIEALEKAGWIRHHERTSRSGQGWRRYEYKLHFPPHIDPSTDAFLVECARKRIDAIDEHRIAEEWAPRSIAEAERRVAKGDDTALAHMWESFDAARYPALDVDVFYRMFCLRAAVANIKKTWIIKHAGMLAQYPPGAQAVLVDWVEEQNKSNLPCHAECGDIIRKRRAAA